MAQVFDLSNIIIHDDHGKILYWTTGCQRLYGCSRDEALGKTVHELLKTKFSGAARIHLRRSFTERGSWQGELEQQTKGRLGSSRSPAFGSHGRTTTTQSLSIQQMNNDITELKRAQSELDDPRSASALDPRTPSPKR